MMEGRSAALSLAMAAAVHGLAGMNSFGRREGVKHPLVDFSATSLGCACETWSKGDARDGVGYCHLEYWYGKTVNGKVWRRNVSGCGKGCVLERVRGEDQCFNAKAMAKVAAAEDAVQQAKAPLVSAKRRTTPPGTPPPGRATDLLARFWTRMRQETPAVGKRFHISNAECRELRDVSRRHLIVVVFSLMRSAATTITSELAAELGGQYMDELFNNEVPLDRHSGGHVVQHTQAQPAALLSELLRALQRPLVFKLNHPWDLPLSSLSQLSRCASWCPVVLERENVRDRWCSLVRAKQTNWWGTRKANRTEVMCPDAFERDTLRSFTARHRAWYANLRNLLLGSSVFVTFDQVVKSTTETRREVGRFCSQHVQKIAKDAPI